MRNFLLVAVALTMFSGVAAADRRGGHGNDHRRASSHRGNAPVRANRPARRADRRAMERNPVFVSDGRFVFANGTSRVYRRPTIRTHYYNASVRPRFIVESYPVQPGYIWVRGDWAWNGSEWQWGGGHYAPDPQYSVYYDDGSYDYSPSVNVGVGIRIGN